MIPTVPYEYEHPEGTGHERPPFASIWYCGVGKENVSRIRWWLPKKNKHNVPSGQQPDGRNWNNAKPFLPRNDQTPNNDKNDGKRINNNHNNNNNRNSKQNNNNNDAEDEEEARQECPGQKTFNEVEKKGRRRYQDESLPRRHWQRNQETFLTVDPSSSSPLKRTLQDVGHHVQKSILCIVLHPSAITIHVKGVQETNDLCCYRASAPYGYRLPRT